jgi:hypothetical protein
MIKINKKGGGIAFFSATRYNSFIKIFTVDNYTNLAYIYMKPG